MITTTTIPGITPEELKALWPDHPAYTEDSLSFTTMYDPKPWPFPETELKTRWAAFEKELDEVTGTNTPPFNWNSMLNTEPQDSTVEVLTERAKNYGKFSGIGQLTQTFKSIMREAPSWPNMQPDQKESLEMIVHKLARILNGNPDYADSWVDIAGYARLVADRLETGLQR